jgi:hypothetical protein
MPAGRPEPRNKEGFLGALKKAILVPSRGRLRPGKKAEFFFSFLLTAGGRRDGQCGGGGGGGGVRGWEETRNATEKRERKTQT